MNQSKNWFNFTSHFVSFGHAIFDDFSKFRTKKKGKKKSGSSFLYLSLNGKIGRNIRSPNIITRTFKSTTISCSFENATNFYCISWWFKQFYAKKVTLSKVPLLFSRKYRSKHFENLTSYLNIVFYVVPWRRWNLTRIFSCIWRFG